MECQLGLGNLQTEKDDTRGISKTMFEDLIAVLAEIKNKIRIHKSILMENETCTRRALIDPLLTVLGWDTSNPAQVIHEYKIEGTSTFVDYALLLQENKTPLAVIEAKRLGASLENKEINQMITYATVGTVPYAALTDGNHWRLYDVFNRVPLPKRCILNISIAEDPEHECILKLLLLWHPNLASRDPVKASSPLLCGKISHPGNTSPSDDPENIQDASKKTGDPIWVPLSKYAVSRGDSPPTAIKFQGVRETHIRYWNEILINVADWMLAESMLTNIPIPYPEGKRICLINTVPVHPSGEDFRSPKEIKRNGRTLYVETNLSAMGIMNKTKELLQYYEVKDQDVLLRKD